MEENTQNIKKSQSDILKWAIIAIVGIVVIVLIFSVGMWAGTEKARFSYRWAESYHQNFGGPRGGFIGDWRQFPAGDLIEGHGSFGKIIKINTDSFVIQSQNNTEEVILVKEDTVIKRLNETLKLSDLKIDDFVTVIGSPNDSGQIEAKLIRVLPAPPVSFLRPGPNSHNNF